jgi:Zn-dependent M28 family amino/carboxypeptidase
MTIHRSRPAFAVLLVIALATTTYARQAATTAPALGPAMLETIKALTGPGMAGRAVGTEGGARARTYIASRLSALALPPLQGTEFARPFAFTPKAGGEVKGVNLVAECRGRRPDAGTVVVSAHYDHLGVRDGQTYHGADDNASGVSLALEVAAHCARTPYAHTVLVAFFDAEEMGLQGARAFLQDPAVKAHSVVLNVNFDMVSRSDRREIYVAGPGRWPLLAPILQPVAAKAPIAVKFGHDTGGGQNDWTTQSDHGVFHAAGIPFVYVGVEDHADYHKPTDTADKIEPEFLSGVASTVLAALAALDAAPTFK